MLYLNLTDNLYTYAGQVTEKLLNNDCIMFKNQNDIKQNGSDRIFRMILSREDLHVNRFRRFLSAQQIKIINKYRLSGYVNAYISRSIKENNTLIAGIVQVDKSEISEYHFMTTIPNVSDIDNLSAIAYKKALTSLNMTKADRLTFGFECLNPIKFPADEYVNFKYSNINTDKSSTIMVLEYALKSSDANLLPGEEIEGV